jgi:hypothetical protein
VTFESNKDATDAGRTPERSGRRASKIRYEKPRLTDYGAVSKLTQTGGITTADTRTHKQSCL